MKIKKILSTSILLIAVIMMVCLATSCSLLDEYGTSEWQTVVEPTCTTIGIQKRVSALGTVEYGKIDTVDHTLVTDAAVDATCTTAGKTEGSHCSACGTVITAQTETPKLSHAFAEWEVVTAPTCTSFGLQKRSCACGMVEYATTDALGHDVVIDKAIAATCTTDGKTEGSHCSVCGVVLAVQSVIAPTGHKCDDMAILEEAVCNRDGIKRFSCSNTDCTYYYDESYSLDELSGDEIFASAKEYTCVLQTFNRFGEIIGASTGFVISADGMIVVNNFLLDNAFSANVILGEECYEVKEVLAYSDLSGIAVVKINATDLPCAKICMDGSVNAEDVYTIGYLDGENYSISRGVISNADIEIYGVNYLQHDADMSLGYAGGPLINRYGEVIGVNIGYVMDNDAYINISTCAFEIYELDYTGPISMEEYGNITYTPTEQLNNWVVNNYNGTGPDTVAYVLQGDTFYYALGYNSANEYSYAEGYWVLESIYQLYVQIIFDNSNGTYQYYATFTDGVFQNEVYGYIEAESYTASTVLEYDTYYGKYWTESELMTVYSEAVCDTLEWFSYCLDTYFDNLTLETFAFTSLSYDRDEEALDKLNSFVMTYGALEPLMGAYALSGGVQMGADLMTFNITYLPDTGDTVVSIHYSLANGSVYSAYLTLNPGEDGNRFDFMYSTYDESGLLIQNTAWGYLDAATLTPMSQLTCYVFDGMNEYQDALLVDYIKNVNNRMIELC